MALRLRHAGLALVVLASGLLRADRAAAVTGPPPPRPYVARNECPGECCQYGAWTALRALVVRSEPRRGAKSSFRIARGERFTALTGDVHVLRPGLIRVVVAFPYDLDGRKLEFAPGDTVWTLHDYGEGAVAGWAGGAPLTVNAEWWWDEFAPPRAKLVRQARTEWWVQVRDHRGRTGWILMPNSGEPSVDGADGCG